MSRSSQVFSGTPGKVEPVDGPLRILSRDEAIGYAKLLMEHVRHVTSVSIRQEVRAITRVANGKILSSDDGNVYQLSFSSVYGTGLPLQFKINTLNPDEVKRIAASATELAKGTPVSLKARDPDPEATLAHGKWECPPVSLWHDSTANAIAEVRREVIPRLIDRVNASGFVGAATLGTVARMRFRMHEAGLLAYCQETDATMTMSVRARDGRSSGWAGQAARDWTRIDPSAITANAIEMAQRSLNSVGMEPGRRVAILGPAAVGQIMQRMSPLVDARRTDRGGTPFSKEPEGNRLTQRVADERVTMVSDPNDPDGGFPPFLPSGLPTQKMAWITDGVLTDLSYDPSYAMQRGKIFSAPPDSLRLGGGTATLDDMIANCEDGIYVNRFSDVSLLDLRTGMMTGVTRDGCFHIKNGKINKPLRNFRFLDSPMFMFNNLVEIGVPERVAFSYIPPRTYYGASQWPPPPIIVPPMMIKDFNFSAMSEAV